MAAFLNACRFTPTAGGTTDWTVSAAVTGYMTPAGAGAVNGRVYKYRAESANLSQWEIGEGAYNSGTGVIARTTVLYNSSGNTSKINFSAPPQVAIIAIKEDLISIEEANGFTSAQQTQARANIGAVLKGHLFGLTMSTAGSSATMTIAAGEAADRTGVRNMVLASATAKTTSSWAVGTTNGGLDTGSIANNTWYHFFLIMRVDTGVVDVLCSLSATAPTLPANYTLFRRIGSAKTNGSAQWVKFFQIGDDFLWDTPTNDVGAFTGSTAIQTGTMNVPSGVKVKAKLNWQSSGSSDSRGWIFSPDQNSPGTLSSSVQTINVGINSSVTMDGQLEVHTNTSSQIKYALFVSSATLYISTQGWADTRGRLE